jgi:hypothetical protein
MTMQTHDANTAETPATTATHAGSRLSEFQAEVDSLKVGGGRANPERAWLKLSIASWIVALAIEVYAWAGSHGTTDALSQRDFLIVAVAGLTLAVIGTGMFAVFMLTRYFRYWLIRLIYQDRESTDRLIDKLGER